MGAGAAVEAARRQLEVQHTQEAQLAANLKAARGGARSGAHQPRVYKDHVAGRWDDGAAAGLSRPVCRVGTQVIAVVPLQHLYVIANYKETQLTHLRVGQRAEIRVDTFPGVVLPGHVASWSPATGSQFALLPPDNATGNFTKVVQRIPVKLALDDADGLGDRLRPGMSVETTIHTDEPGRRQSAPK